MNFSLADAAIKDSYRQSIIAQIENDSAFFAMLEASTIGWCEERRIKRFDDGIPMDWR